jgi:hypothetical protein
MLLSCGSFFSFGRRAGASSPYGVKTDIEFQRTKELDLMRNKLLALIGLVLIGAGAVALSYRGIPYTSRDVVVDVGPITATAESNRTWPVPAVVSGLAIVGGILLIVVGLRKSDSRI